MGEENHNLCCVFVPNSAKSPRSLSLDYFDYLTILITSQVTKIALLIKVLLFFNDQLLFFKVN